MALEIVGTAYVRIRAITTGLADDIKKGFDDGVKDAGLDNSGEGAADEFSKGFGKESEKGIPDALDASFSKGVKDVDFEGGGGDSASRFGDGFDKETKKKNPFRALVDAFKKIGKDITPDDIDLPDLNKQGEASGTTASTGFFSGFKKGLSKLAGLFGISWTKAIDDVDFEGGGEESAVRYGKGVTKGAKKKDPFKDLFKSFGEGIDKIAKTPIGWAALLNPAALAPVIGIVTSLLASVVSVLGFVVLAAAGAGVALGGIAAAAIPGLGVLFAAFKTNTKQLDAFKKSATKLLAPWKEVGAATQKFLLPGLTSALKAFQHLIPLFSQFGQGIGKIVGNFAELAGKTLTSEKNMSALGEILDASTGFFENMSAAAGSVLDAILPLFAAMAPLAVQLSGSLKTMAENFANFVNAGAGSGTLTETFQGWYDKFVLLAGILGDVFTILFSVLSIAGNTSTPFFDKVKEVTGAWAAFVKSPDGQNKIKTFFDNAKPVVEELFGLIGDVFKLVFGPLATSLTEAGDGGASKFQGLADSLAKVRDVLQDPLMQQFAPWIVGVSTALLGLSKVGLLTPVLSLFGTVLGQLIGPLGQFVKGIVGFESAEGILGAIGFEFGAIILGLAAAVGILAAVWFFWDDIVSGLKTAWEWFTKLSTPMKIFIGLLAALAAVAVVFLAVWIGWPALIVAVGVALIALVKNWDTVVAALKVAFDAIVGFITRIPEMLGKIPDLLIGIGKSILGFFEDLPGNVISALGPLADAVVGFLEPVGAAILGFFEKLPGQVVSALSSFGGAVRDTLLGAVRALPNLLLDALGGLVNVGQAIIGFIAGGLAQALPVLAQFFVELPFKILGFLGDIAGKLLPIGISIIEAILKGLAEFGTQVFAFFLTLPLKILTVIREGLSALGPIGHDIIVAIVTGLDAALGAILRFAGDLIGALVGGLTDAAPRILDFFKTLPATLLAGLVAASQWLFSVGGDIIEGLWQGIQNNWDKVLQFFKDLPETFVQFLRDAGTLLKGVGESLIKGLKAGIDAIWKDVKDFFGDLPKTILDTIRGGLGLLSSIGSTIITTILNALGAAIPALLRFFINLPGDILKLFIAGVQAFASVGLTIITGIFNALIAAAPTLFNWFINLPGQILGFLVTAFVAVFNFFTGLPAQLLGFLVAGIQVLFDFFTGLPLTILNAIIAAVPVLFDWFTSLPGKLFDFVTGAIGKLADLGGDFILNILIGIGKLEFKVFDFFKELPGKLVATVTDLVSTIGGFGSDIIQKIWDGLQLTFHIVTDFFKALPGKLVGAVVDLVSTIGGFGGDLIQKLLDGLNVAVHLVTDFFKNLPGELVKAAGDILTDVFNFGKNLIQKIVDGIKAAPSKITDALKSLIPSPGDLLGKLNPFDASSTVLLRLVPALEEGVIPGFAKGTIVTRPVLARLGEAGSEVVIPLTQPSRALQLAHQTGLDKLVLDNLRTQTGATTGSDVTMLRIDQAVFSDKVDVDIVSARILSAYKAAVA